MTHAEFLIAFYQKDRGRIFSNYAPVKITNNNYVVELSDFDRDIVDHYDAQISCLSECSDNALINNT